MKTFLIVAVSLFAVSFSVRAETLSLKTCAAIDDPAERYACYDRLSGRSPDDTTKSDGAAPGVIAPAAPGDNVAVPAAPATPVPAVEPGPNAKANFGLEHDSKSKKDRPDELNLKWTRLDKDARGKWIITMENGQVWRQTDSRRFDFGNAENRVTVYRGFGGGFFLGEPESRVRIRVKRVR